MRWRWIGWPAVVAFVAAATLYAATLAPGLTWAHAGADGGDLLAAALTRGVPHPPGYPTYQALLRAAIALYPGEPARAGNWLSALCMAAAAGTLADLAQRMLSCQRGAASASSGDEPHANPKTGEHPERVCKSRRLTNSDQSQDAAFTPKSGREPSWTRGFSRFLTSSTQPAEASSPVATPFISALSALAAALAWAAAPVVWGQATITEVYGLHALACLAVLWLLWRWRADRRRAAAGTRWLAAAGLICGLGLGNHLSLALLFPAALVWLAAGRPPRRDLLIAALWLAAGLSVYAYLPVAAAGQPPVNWGDPRTIGAWLWVVSGQLYRGLVFGAPLADLPARAAALAGDLLRQFGIWGALLALAGLWRLDREQRLWWRATVLVALAYAVYAVGYRTGDAFIYLIPAWAMAALWLAAGISWVGEAAARWFRWPAAGLVVAAAAVIVLPGISLVRYGPENDLRGDAAARNFVAATLAAAEPDAIILTASDGPTFALWYAIYGLGQRPDLAPLNVNLFDFAWYRLALHRHHPAAMSAADICGAAPDLAGFVARSAAQRPVYRAEPLDLNLPGVREQPAGPLVRILTTE